MRVFSSDGTPLSDPIDGSKFSNQILVEGDRLYVVDTNSHRVRVLDTRPEALGADVASKDVIPELAVEAGQRLPSHLASVGDAWWVNNMRSGMNEGMACDIATANTDSSFACVSLAFERYFSASV